MPALQRGSGRVWLNERWNITASKHLHSSSICYGPATGRNYQARRLSPDSQARGPARAAIHKKRPAATTAIRSLWEAASRIRSRSFVLDGEAVCLAPPEYPTSTAWFPAGTTPRWSFTLSTCSCSGADQRQLALHLRKNVRARTSRREGPPAGLLGAMEPTTPADPDSSGGLRSRPTGFNDQPPARFS